MDFGFIKVTFVKGNNVNKHLRRRDVRVVSDSTNNNVLLTDHRLDDAFRHPDELLVDLDGQVAQHLSILGQVEVLQTVFILFGCVLHHERLETNHNMMTCQLEIASAPVKGGRLSHLVSTVLLQTVKEATGVGQPEGRHLKVLVFLKTKTFSNKNRSGRMKESTGGGAAFTFRTFLMVLMVAVRRDSTLWSSLM